MRRPLVQLGMLAVALASVIAMGCFFAGFCPVGPGVTLQKNRLAGTWRVSMLGQESLSGATTGKLSRTALMIDGKTFITFDLFGNLQYIGTLGADESVALWEINLTTRTGSVGLTFGLPLTGMITVSDVSSSVAQQDDGTIAARMGWRQHVGSESADTDVEIVFEQMRLGLVDGQLTALMTRTEFSSADPAPPQTRLVGEVLLERIEPEIRQLTGDIHPVGEITALPGPSPPYNEAVTFETGQYFTLSASGTTGPSGAELSYYWHVVRELTDPSTNQVTQRERVLVFAGPNTGFVAGRPGRFYVTLYVTDGVLWRSTQALGQTGALTRFVKVE